MRVKSCFISFIFTSLILLSGFALGGMFPFGSGTVAWCDMNQQGIPLLCDFKDILSGESGFFLNMKNASGMNFYGVFFFFLSSPFSFLAAFVEKTDIPFLINILTVLKLSLASLTATLFFEKYFKNLPYFTSVFLGSAYGLCGYGMMYSQNIMWLDIMYVFPLVLAGILNLINKDKPLLLILSLTVCVIMNYYISFMVYLFVILFFGLFAIYYRKADKKIYFKLGCSGLLSLLLSAVVWLPSFLQYAESARRGNILRNLQHSGFLASYDTTLQIILSSGIIIAVLIILIPKLSSKAQTDRFLGLVFFLMFLPLIVEPVNLMWHTGSYMAFPSRFGFITVFMGTVLCAREISSAEFSEKSSKLHLTFLIPILIFLISFMLWFTDNRLERLSKYVGTLWGNKNSLENLIILCSFAVMAYVFVLKSAINRKLSRQIFSFLLCGILIAEGICTTRIYLNSADGEFNLTNFRNFTELQKSADKEGFYRVNTFCKYTDANNTGAAGFNSISHYTSLNRESTMEAAKQLGYTGYWMETGNWCGNIMSDSLLSVGYTAFRSGYNYHLEENPCFLGLGIKCKKNIPEIIKDGNRLEEIGKIYASVTGCEYPVKSYKPEHLQNCIYSQTDKVHNLQLTEGTEGKLIYKVDVKDKESLYFDCYNGFSNKLKEDINYSFDVSVNGITRLEKYPLQDYNGLLNLGTFQNETVNIEVTVKNPVSCFSFGVFGVDETKVKNGAAQTETLNLNSKGSSLEGKVTEKGDYFLSIPYCDNYKITLDGKKVDFRKALTGYTLLHIENTGNLKIRAVSKGFTEGIIISVIGVILLVLMLVFRKQLNNLPHWIYMAVFGIFISVFTLTFFAVYIEPIIINITL